MDNNFSIGNRIRELRNQKHLSQDYRRPAGPSCPF